MARLDNDDTIEWTQKKVTAALSRLLSRMLRASTIMDLVPESALEELWLKQFQSPDPAIVRSALREINEMVYGKAGIREKVREKDDKNMIVSFRSSKKEPPKELPEPLIAS